MAAVDFFKPDLRPPKRLNQKGFKVDLKCEGTRVSWGLLKKLQMRGRRDRGDRSVLGRYVRIYEGSRTKQMDFFSSPFIGRGVPP